MRMVGGSESLVLMTSLKQSRYVLWNHVTKSEHLDATVSKENIKQKL